MNLTQLRYFLAAAEALNYSKAAKQLYVSRQALRQALQLLEGEFETPLFVNRRNKLSLTAAGEYLYTAGAEAVEKFDKATEGMKRFAGQGKSLCVAVSQSLFPFMVPDMDKIVKRFQDRYPAFCLEFLPLPNDEAIGAVRDGRCGCGLVIQMPCRRPGLAMEVLTRYDAIISFGENIHHPARQPIGLHDLKGRLCIGMGSLYETMRPFYEACREEKVELQYEVVSSTIDAFYRVAHEDAMAFDILTEDTPFYHTGSYGILEGYYWEIGLLYREASRHREAEEVFGRFLKEELERMEAGN